MAIVPKPREAIQTRSSPTVFQSARGATPDAFGAGIARAQGEGGASLVQAGGQATAFAEEELAEIAAADLRIQRREDAINKLRGTSEFNTRVSEEFQRELDEGDAFTTIDSVKAYKQRISDAGVAAIAEFQGSAKGRAEFELAITEVVALAQDAAVTEGMTQASAEMNRLLGERISLISDGVRVAPATIEAADQAVTAEVAALADASTPEQTASQLAAGLEANSVAAYDHFMAVGDVESARLILNERGKFMSQEILQKNRNRLVKMEFDLTRAADEKAGDRARIEAALGRSMTEAEILRHEGIAPTGGKQTLAQEIAAFEAAVDRPATEAEIAKMAGADVAATGEDSLFGNSLTGRAMTIVVEDTPAYAANNLGPQGDLEFTAAALLASRADPITGLKAELPPATRSALQSRGINPDDISGQLGLATPGEPVAAAAVEPVAAATPDPAATAEPGVPDPTGEALLQRQQLAGVAPGFANSGVTLMDMANEATGLFSAVAQAAGSIPIIGRGSIDERIKRQIGIAINGMVEPLARGREGDTQTQRILDTFELNPEIFSNARDFQDKVLGTILGLETLKSIATTVLNSTTSAEQKRESLDRIALIEGFQAILGPPLLPETADPEQLLSLMVKFSEENPPGTRFMYTEPSTRRPAYGIVPDPEALKGLKKQSSGGSKSDG